MRKIKERLKAAEAKRIEKERTEKYTKMKSQAKDDRAKFREKVLNPKKYNWNDTTPTLQTVQYKLEATPPPSDEEDESSDEEDGFGPKKEKVEEDPVARKLWM